MTDVDLFAFMDAFRGLQRVFPKRLDDLQTTQLGQSYFKALRRFPLSQVQAGADAWIQRGKFFPKPAEWMDAIPRARTTQPAIPELSALEASDYLAAERRRYDGEPCGCPACRSAGVDHRPTRFVPEFDAITGLDLRARIGERVVVRGHWAHGDELARWYAAKEKFWREAHSFFQTKRWPSPRGVDPSRIDLYGHREPGEEG